MLSFIFDKALILVVVLNVYGLSRVLADDFKDFKQRDEDNIQMRDARDSDGMWFGPRIGKRSLHLSSENDRQDLYRMLEAADALKYYYDQLRVQYYTPQSDEPETKVSKKVIFTPKLGRSAQEDNSLEVDFTPRLGRRRSEAGTPTEKSADQQQYRFQPRLGRGGSMTFSPRLGRNLVYDLYSDGKIRVARSANKTKSN